MLAYLTVGLGGVAAISLLVVYLFPWLKMDFKQLLIYSRPMRLLAKYVFQRHTLVDIFEQQVQQHPEKTFIIFQV